MTPKHIRVFGGGPAGCAAAISALQHEAAVALVEKSRFPRHKVCGEFISPGAAEVLRALGLWDDFLACRPASVLRMVLVIGDSRKSCALPEPAFGLSRYALDTLLFNKAVTLGAAAVRNAETVDPIDVLAVGRRELAPRGRRLFGFKAHFHGPASDAVELYFSRGSYVGVSPVEGGVTNVCGLAPETMLVRCKFGYDAFIGENRALTERLRPLTQTIPWITVGPLVFRNRARSWSDPHVYPAGDALSFVDPFTGSGILSALLTGRLAGIAAARQTPMEEYLADCRHALSPAFGAASLFRTALSWGVAERLAPFIPAEWMFRVTRPRAAAIL